MDVQINGHKNSDKANQILHTANAAPFRGALTVLSCVFYLKPRTHGGYLQKYTSTLLSLSFIVINISARSRDTTKIMRRGDKERSRIHVYSVESSRH